MIQDNFNYDEKIFNLSKQIDNTPNMDFNKKFDLLKKLKDLINEKEYYDKLKSLFKLTLVDVLPLDIKEKYENFYQMDKKLERIRKK